MKKTKETKQNFDLKITTFENQINSLKTLLNKTEKTLRLSKVYSDILVIT